ncbi:MAG: 5-formyltetrahydrofolate cyclo-ligase [Treponema sp.]|nr:5-formyltetrahydrofolate cyclo-ligase [Treponema sp.]
MNNENTADFKKKLRKEMKQSLTEFHANHTESEKSEITKQLCQKVMALPEYQTADVILAYIPSDLEADCTSVIVDALQNGKKVAVPKVEFDSLKTGKNRMDFYFLENGTPLEAQLEVGTYGIREPKPELKKVFGGVAGDAPAERGATNEMGARGETSPLKDIFILVPGVAFTQNGKRLGHGKGFYDIYIERVRRAGENPFLCGFCLPCQILPELPTDSHDIFMDAVLF